MAKDRKSSDAGTLATLSLPFEKIVEIARTGIRRASRFSRFAASSEVSQSSYARFTDGDRFLQFTMSPMFGSEDEFNHWHSIYINWSYCNAITEIVESFLIFLEMTIVVLEMDDQTVPLPRGQHPVNVVFDLQKEIRKKYGRFKDIKKYLRDRNVFLSEDEEKIILSFFEIRHLLTHNGGIAEKRNDLHIEDGNITFSWYQPKIAVVGIETGKERELSAGDGVDEDSKAVLKTKELFTKGIPCGMPIVFYYNEVQEIGWTFNFMVMDVAEKVKTFIQSKRGVA